MLNEMIGAAANKVTVTTHENILTRLVNSVVGVLIGIVLFLLSFVILWWNEGNVIAEKGALNEMRKAVVKVSAEAPSASQNGRLVFAQSDLKSAAKLGDEPYIKPGNYLAVERVVEMYQWIEKSESTSKKSVGGGKTTETTYTYAKGWATGRQDSTRFQIPAGHENPALAVEKAHNVVAQATFGKYDGKSILERLPPRENLAVTSDMLANPKAKNQAVNKGLLYIKKSPPAAGDTVGDVRLSYRVVKPGAYSVMAKQAPGNKLGVYRAKNGKENFLVEAGKRTPQQMIAVAKNNASTAAMLFRVLGFFAMWIGLNLLTGPLTTLLDVIPFFGSAGRFVLGLVWGVVSFVLSAITIVVSMVAHHPILLVLALGGGAGAIFYFVRVYKPQKAARAGGAAPGAGAQSTPKQSNAA